MHLNHGGHPQIIQTIAIFGVSQAIQNTCWNQAATGFRAASNDKDRPMGRKRIYMLSIPAIGIKYLDVPAILIRATTKLESAIK